ncbi:peptide-methionine (R)-S-oxide reductase [Candidatus Microgenomates bacterium]|nr:peptide-methionine (R)-S-oxide reductase [Candidatus Microgenomates bacterium]
MPYNKLTPQEEKIIENKGTEAPFSGEYDDFYKDGSFIEIAHLEAFGSEAQARRGGIA